MTTPQPGIFAQGTVSHSFLEYMRRPTAGADMVTRALAALRQPSVNAGGVNLVVAFGSALSRMVAPDVTPRAMHDFTAIEGSDGHAAPATQRDLWLWINGSTGDVTFEHARAFDTAVADAFELVAEQRCFVQRDSRDLTGFIDGTANPLFFDAPGVALLPPGEPGAGGSYVLAMRFVHDLDAFDRLPVVEQQRVFGRTKIDSIELADKPPTAHIARVEIHDGAGDELPIFRRSVPYGTVREHGLYFVAFSQDQERIVTMLRRMFGAAEDGCRDRLTDFTRPVSGAFYFAPPLDLFARMAGSDAGAD